MFLIFYILIFVFGLFVGSFLNVVIFRVKSGAGFIWGRSHCPECKKTLHWFDLVPVLSFFALKGKCRYCQKKISIQYPLVELATGALFAAFLWRTAFLIDFAESPGLFLITLFYYCFFASVLIVIFVYDLKHYLILDKIVFTCLFLSLPAITFMPGINGLSAIIAALSGSGFLGIILLLTRGKGMGAGDVKFALLLGFMTGWPLIIVTFFLAFSIGAIVGLVLILFKIKNLKSEIPFGTFLGIAAIITLLAGKELLEWYLSFVI